MGVKALLRPQAVFSAALVAATIASVVAMVTSISSQAFRGDDFTLVSRFAGLPVTTAFADAFQSWEPLLGVGPWAEGPRTYQLFRPASLISFSLNARICGVTPTCLAAGNVVLLLMAGAALYGCARMLGVRPGPSLGAGVIFSISPGVISSTLAIVDRTEAIAGFGLLTGLFTYAHCRRASSVHTWLAWLVATLCACAIAMGSKETAVLLPVILLGQSVIFGDRKARSRRFTAEVLSFASLLGVYVAARFMLFGSLGEYSGGRPSLASLPGNLVDIAGALLFFDRSQLYERWGWAIVVTVAAILLAALVLRDAIGAPSARHRLLWIVFVGALSVLPALTTDVYARLLVVPSAMLAIVIATAVDTPRARRAEILAAIAGGVLVLDFLLLYQVKLADMRAASRRVESELAALELSLDRRGTPSVAVGYPADAFGMAIFHESFDDAVRSTFPDAGNSIVGLVGTVTSGDTCDMSVVRSGAVVTASTAAPCAFVLPRYPKTIQAGNHMATRFAGIGPLVYHSAQRVTFEVDPHGWTVLASDGRGGWTVVP